MKNKNKILIFTFIIVILLVLFCVFYFCKIKPKKSGSFENLLNLKTNENIIENGFIDSYGEIKFNVLDLKNIPWNIKNPNLRSSSYQIQFLAPVSFLLITYDKTKEDRYLLAAKNICLEWARLHPIEDKDSQSNFAWYDMAVGLRAINIAYVLDICTQKNILNKDEYNLLYKSLTEHAQYLMDDKNIAFHSNHGLYQVAAQIIIGKRFYEKNKIFKNSYWIGKKRLDKMIKSQYYSEGVHKENSPGYHLYVYYLLKSLDDNEILNLSQKHLLKKIKKATYWFILPNEKLLNFGDTDYDMTLNNNIENIPNKKHKYFKKSAYFIIKLKNSYLAQHASFISITHKHADDLNIFWYDLGQPILVDSGKFGYPGRTAKGSNLNRKGFKYSNINRIFIESTRAHNTLEFNNESNYRTKKDFYNNAFKKVAYKNETYYIKSEVNLRGIIFTRNLIYKPEKYLIVFDEYNSTKKQLEDVKQWFHFAPDLIVEKKENNYLVKLKNNNVITVSQLNKDVTATKLYKGYRSNSLMQGFVSYDENKILENYALAFENKQNKQFFLTVFEINDNKVPKDLIKELLNQNK